MKKRNTNVFWLFFILLFNIIFFRHNGYALQNYDLIMSPFVRMEISSSMNPTGSGARAIGMGSAFISVADDATAASWNPGGLIQLDQPETSLVLDYTYRKEGNDFGKIPEANNKASVSDFKINYLSFAYPFCLNDTEMIVSLNIQHLYDFNIDWQFIVDHNTPGFASPVQYSYQQNGGIYGVGLAYSIQVSPKLSAGITFNYNGKLGFQQYSWKQDYREKGSLHLPPPPASNRLYGYFNHHKEEEFSLKGFNANIGFLYRISEKLTVGGVLKTPYKATIDHCIKEEWTIHFPDSPDDNTHLTKFENYKENLRIPMSYGLGVAFRFSDAFTMSADIYQTNWKKFEYEHEDGNRTSPITGKKMIYTDINNTTWFRMGAEYQFIRKTMIIPLRAGIMIDPSPDHRSPDDYYGFSVGSGISLYSGYAFDIGYQFRTGNNVGSSRLSNHHFSQDVREHKLFSSMIIYF